MSQADLVTRCPECRTGFRLTAEQMQQRDGRVRCGRCNGIFDARANLMVQLLSRIGNDPRIDRAQVSQASPRPAVTRSRTRNVEPPADQTESAQRPDALDVDDGHEPHTPMAPFEIEDFTLIRKRRRWVPLMIGGVISLVLLAALGYQFRHVLAARFPVMRPILLEICTTLGCTVQLERALDNLQIESSELRVDDGVLTLVATLRNRGDSTLAAPDFDLTLSNEKGQTVLQRRYNATQYLAGRSELASGIGAGSQIEFSVRIDDARSDALGYVMRLINH